MFILSNTRLTQPNFHTTNYTRQREKGVHSLELTNIDKSRVYWPAMNTWSNDKQRFRPPDIRPIVPIESGRASLSQPLHIRWHIYSLCSDIVISHSTAFKILDEVYLWLTFMWNVRNVMKRHRTIVWKAIENISLFKNIRHVPILSR